MPQEILSPSLAGLSLVWLMFTVSFPPAGMKVTRAVFPSRTARVHPTLPAPPQQLSQGQGLSWRGSIILNGSHLEQDLVSGILLVVGCVYV